MWLIARRLRKSVSAGLSSASFCRDRQRRAVLGLRLRRLARQHSRSPSIVVTARQIPAEAGDGGVFVRQLLLDRQRRAELGLRLRGLPVIDSTLPRSMWLVARPLRNSVTAGFSSASFC